MRTRRHEGRLPVIYTRELGAWLEIFEIFRLGVVTVLKIGFGGVVSGPVFVCGFGKLYENWNYVFGQGFVREACGNFGTNLKMFEIWREFLLAPVWGLKFEIESKNGTQNQRGRRLNNDARHTWSQRGTLGAIGLLSDINMRLFILFKSIGYLIIS